MVITGRREEVLKEAVSILGINAFYLVNDVTDLSQTIQLVEDIESKFGPINTLVNNAGINMKKPSVEVTDGEFANIIQTNLQAVFSLTREVAKK